jgi:hypothetical protein
MAKKEAKLPPIIASASIADKNLKTPSPREDGALPVTAQIRGPWTEQAQRKPWVDDEAINPAEEREKFKRREARRAERAAEERNRTSIDPAVEAVLDDVRKTLETPDSKRTSKAGSSTMASRAKREKLAGDGERGL